MLRVGLIGLGTVGTGVYEGLKASKLYLENILGCKVNIVKVLVNDRFKQRDVEITEGELTDDSKVFLSETYDVIFEAIGGIHPAKEYIHYYLSKGIPVITANKELVAKYGEELEKVAYENETFFGYEAAVAGGIPIVNVLRSNLSWTTIHKVSGIINGTTNYILTEMNDKGRNFEDVLRETQELGYAESDPTDDVEGFDAWYKICILSRLCFGCWPDERHITKKGISDVKSWHVELAKELGLKLKLIAEATFDGEKIIGTVSPSFLTTEHPLYRIEGVTNAVSLSTEPIGDLLLTGAGAGKGPTSASMIEDFIHLSQKRLARSMDKRLSQVDNSQQQVFICFNNDKRDELELTLDTVDYTTNARVESNNHTGWYLTLASGEWQKVEPFIKASWYFIYGQPNHIDALTIVG